MNYDRKGLHTSQPNIVIGAYNRQYQREMDTKQLYQDIQNQHKQELEAKRNIRQQQLGYESSYINKEVKSQTPYFKHFSELIGIKSDR